MNLFDIYRKVYEDTHFQIKSVYINDSELVSDLGSLALIPYDGKINVTVCRISKMFHQANCGMRIHREIIKHETIIHFFDSSHTPKINRERNEYGVLKYDSYRIDVNAKVDEPEESELIREFKRALGKSGKTKGKKDYSYGCYDRGVDMAKDVDRSFIWSVRS